MSDVGAFPQSFVDMMQIRKAVDGLKRGRAVKLVVNDQTWQAQVCRPSSLTDDDVVLIDPSGVREVSPRGRIILELITERQQAGTDLREDRRPPKSDRARELKQQARESKR